METCKTCKFWWEFNISGSGECERLLNCWQLSIETEKTTEYGPYGEEYIDHPVECINTDESFGCNLWEKDDVDNRPLCGRWFKD